MTETFEHAEPEFYAKYQFCRVDCRECDRLDIIDKERGMDQAEALILGMEKAFAALAAEMRSA